MVRTAFFCMRYSEFKAVGRWIAYTILQYSRYGWTRVL